MSGDWRELRAHGHAKESRGARWLHETLVAPACSIHFVLSTTFCVFRLAQNGIVNGIKIAHEPANSNANSNVRCLLESNDESENSMFLFNVS